jgi:hypothetical protein
MPTLDGSSVTFEGPTRLAPKLEVAATSCGRLIFASSVFFTKEMKAMKDVWKRYRSGDHEYVMEYHNQPDGTIKLFCTKHPENRFSASPHATHLYADNSLCIAADKRPRTFERAEAIAFVWMEGFSHYVRTGTSIPTGGRVNVP